jgi:hypothetical protein
MRNGGGLLRGVGYQLAYPEKHFAQPSSVVFNHALCFLGAFIIVVSTRRFFVRVEVHGAGAYTAKLTGTLHGG